jgi:hypothetical protein
MDYKTFAINLNVIVKSTLSILLLVIVSLIFGLGSCSTLMTKCYGVKKIKPVKEHTILD